MLYPKRNSNFFLSTSFFIYAMLVNMESIELPSTGLNTFIELSEVHKLASIMFTEMNGIYYLIIISLILLRRFICSTRKTIKIIFYPLRG